MSRGKFPGYDGLSSHLRNGGVHLPHVLFQFYHVCLCHVYLPKELTEMIVVPSIKNRIKQNIVKILKKNWKTRRIISCITRLRVKNKWY